MQAVAKTPIEVPTSNLKWKWFGLSNHSSARRGILSFLLEMPEAGAAVGGGIIENVHKQFHCHHAQRPASFSKQFNIFFDKERGAGSSRRRVRVIAALLGQRG